MARKPKATGDPKPPKRRKMTQEAQSGLFIETVRQLGVDETGEEFERAFGAVTQPAKITTDMPVMPEKADRKQSG